MAPIGRVGAGLCCAALLTAALAGTPLVAQAKAAGGLTNGDVEALALQWFGRMETGNIDRTQLAPAYSAQLTPEAVRELSNYLKEHDYGVPPKSAQILDECSSADQTFYVVKLVFPRGDATSFLLGLDTGGKITGISLMSLAGD